jgi:feruloyl esterase
VEEGQVPATIPATKFVNDKPEQGVAFSRPLCPYPQRARFKGEGDPNDAASFVCAPGRRYPDPLTAPLYQR